MGSTNLEWFRIITCRIKINSGSHSRQAMVFNLMMLVISTSNKRVFFLYTDNRTRPARCRAKRHLCWTGISPGVAQGRKVKGLAKMINGSKDRQ